MMITENFLESEELVEKTKEKSLHRKRRESKMRDKQGKEDFKPDKNKNRSARKMKKLWDDDEDYSD
ncbi:hypothetical protein [Paenibacillus polymyxa]|uniref:Uncharacterized protein n=1 Tax=Paenibacillus polymyxa (strain SC2) TaxID=886882 RepID=E3EK86_PAEPS|nr:hypothetical protein [Paenibacillus polymyxa]ADO59413.1 hypothetical protein PPSC2_27990 [Paenibacillus polymyxa SC2]WPQ59746.1 hypothetical protein SKN87_26010 [Paenibacillus polymyxa]